MIKKLDHEIVRIIERNLTKLQQPTPLKTNFEFLPVKCKLLHWSKISSKKIKNVTIPKHLLLTVELIQIKRQFKCEYGTSISNSEGASKIF